MYIKIKNNEIEQYPYYENNLKTDNPQVSFPDTLSEDLLAEFNIYKVIESIKPTVTYKQNIHEDTPINENGTWKQVWVITDKSLEEINSINEANKKNDYIEESDPLFFKWQRGEVSQQEWLDKVAEIKQRWI